MILFTHQQNNLNKTPVMFIFSIIFLLKMVLNTRTTHLVCCNLQFHLLWFEIIWETALYHTLDSRIKKVHT